MSSSPQSFTITPVRSPTDLSAAICLIESYTRWLNVDLSFQNLQAEISGMPGQYAPPTGELFLARHGGTGEALGCVGLRPLTGRCCEMKRLYVTEAGRGRGLGTALVQAVVDTARHLGYREMRLDTLDHMHAARSTYRKFGFVPIEPYYSNPLPGATYWALRLDGS